MKNSYYLTSRQVVELNLSVILWARISSEQMKNYFSWKHNVKSQNMYVVSLWSSQEIRNIFFLCIVMKMESRFSKAVLWTLTLI